MPLPFINTTIQRRSAHALSQEVGQQIADGYYPLASRLLVNDDDSLEPEVSELLEYRLRGDGAGKHKRTGVYGIWRMSKHASGVFIIGSRANRGMVVRVTGQFMQ